jgi:hypothetical protein
VDILAVVEVDILVVVEVDILVVGDSPVEDNYFAFDLFVHFRNYSEQLS